MPRPRARYTKSCGCKRAGLVSEKNKTHGFSKTKFYSRWRSMHDRTSETYIDSAAYKGVSVCRRWFKFENFKDDMYESWLKHVEEYGIKNTTLDRISVYGNYVPGNCRWATDEVQSLNKKDTIKIIINGIETPLTKICREKNRNYATTRNRLKLGWPIEELFLKGKWHGGRPSLQLAKKEARESRSNQIINQ